MLTPRANAFITESYPRWHSASTETQLEGDFDSKGTQHSAGSHWSRAGKAGILHRRTMQYAVIECSPWPQVQMYNPGIGPATIGSVTVMPVEKRR